MVKAGRSPSQFHQRRIRFWALRLLIISCSARKIAATKPTAALNVYDGPLYRALRRRRADGSFPSDIVIKIVSAKHGLLSEDAPIRSYDKRLDPKRDARLLAETRSSLAAIVKKHAPTSVCISLGKDYAQALPALDDGVAVRVQGPPGSRVRKVLDWSVGT
jgi:hypothetical protein